MPTFYRIAYFFKAGASYNMVHLFDTVQAKWFLSTTYISSWYVDVFQLVMNQSIRLKRMNIYDTPQMATSNVTCLYVDQLTLGSLGKTLPIPTIHCNLCRKNALKTQFGCPPEVFSCGFGRIGNQKPPVDNQIDFYMHFLAMSCNIQAATDGWNEPAVNALLLVTSS